MITCISAAVFLDTEVFDKHGRDLTCNSLRRITRLAKAGEIELLLTSINEQEIRSHMDADATNAFKALHNYRRASRLVKRVIPDPKYTPEDEIPYRKQVQAEFDEFVKEARIQIISVDIVSPERVFRDYFAGNAPFAAGDKKSEFPDAFAIEAIRIWSESHNTQIFVISGDKDWRASFKNHPTIRVKTSIDELLEELLSKEKVAIIKEFLNSQLEKLSETILESAEELEFTLSDSLWNGELGCCSIDDVEVDEFHVVEAENGLAQVVAYCKLKVNAEVSADDSMSAWRDPDTKDMNCVWQLGGEVEKEVEAEITISIEYTGEIPDQCQIASIEFNSKDIFIEVDEDDLARIGEDENIDDFSNHFDTE